MTRITLSFVVLLAALLSGQAGFAQTRSTDCSKADQVVVNDAVAGAKSMAMAAAVAIADDALFYRWFGKFRLDRAETARATYKAVYDAIRTGRVVVVCEARRSPDCEGDIYAYVYSDQPFLVHVCRPFFDLPPMAALHPMAEESLNGTREGTIIHEMSHFHVVAGTEDNCYSRSDCSDMAVINSGAVIENADSYQYYAEDVVFFVGKSTVKVGRETGQLMDDAAASDK